MKILTFATARSCNSASRELSVMCKRIRFLFGDRQKLLTFCQRQCLHGQVTAFLAVKIHETSLNATKCGSVLQLRFARSIFAF